MLSMILLALECVNTSHFQCYSYLALYRCVAVTTQYVALISNAFDVTKSFSLLLMLRYTFHHPFNMKFHKIQIFFSNMNHAKEK